MLRRRLPTTTPGLPSLARSARRSRATSTPSRSRRSSWRTKSWSASQRPPTRWGGVRRAWSRSPCGGRRGARRRQPGQCRQAKEEARQAEARRRHFVGRRAGPDHQAAGRQSPQEAQKAHTNPLGPSCTGKPSLLPVYLDPELNLVLAQAAARRRALADLQAECPQAAEVHGPHLDKFEHY